MCRPHTCLLASLCLLLLSTPVLCAADTASSVPQMVRGGTLTNGLGFSIFPRHDEPGRVSIRFIVHAGSLDERDDERGYAHFVEHMAFNGTQHFPPGKLLPFFERLGVSWSADVNADTSFSSTVYRIDLPQGSAATLEQIFQVFADFAGGVSFDPKEVSRERGVVLSELGAIDTAELQARIARVALFYAGTPYPARLPLVAPDAVRHVDAKDLRRFYDRCYQPGRMSLIVVGDVAAAETVELIRKAFGQLRARARGAAPVVPGKLTAPNLSAHVLVEPLAPAAGVQLVRVIRMDGDERPNLDTLVRFDVVLSLLDERLSARRAKEPDVIGDAHIVRMPGVDLRFWHVGLRADSARDNWPAAVRVVESELRRARERGFTANEVREAVDTVIARLKSEASRLVALRYNQFADELTASARADVPFVPPTDMLSVAERYRQTFGPADASAALAALFPDKELRLVVASPVPPEGGATAVLAAYRASCAEPLPTNDAPGTDALTFQYTDFGPPGTIVEQKAAAELGIELVRFSNGVMLNLKPGKAEPGRFRLGVRLGRGTFDVPKDKPGIALYALALLSRCDVGRHTREELSRLNGLNGLTGNWAFEDNNATIQLEGPMDVLPYALGSVTALLADAKLDEAKMREARSRYLALTRSILSTAADFAKAEAIFRAGNDDPRLRIPSVTEVEKYTFAELREWIEGHWLQGPIEVGLIGDFEADSAAAAVARTLGALPTRPDAQPQAEPLQLRTTPIRNLSGIELPGTSAAVRFFWPSHQLPDLRTRRALQLGARAVRARLWEKLRQELGATYSPNQFVYAYTLQPDFGYVAIDMTFSPAQAMANTEQTLKLVAEYASQGLTAEEFERTRLPLKTSAAADLQSNAWWATSVLTWAQTRPAVLDEAKTHATGYDDLDRDTVNRILAAHLGSKASNCVGFVPHAAAPKAAPGKARKPK